jgi:acetolactate synthase I/II/III large subunit
VTTPEGQPATRRLTGGRALAEMIGCAGTRHLFGMGGFQLLPFYEGVRQLGLSHHLIDDERAGAFAADALARVTGRPGVCDATLGPGATNLVTGLVESLNAGIPLIALIGDTHREHSWKNMTQEARQLDILRPAAKDVIRIEVGQRIPELIRRAFSVATSGRPGPVVVSVPEDVAHGEYEFALSELTLDARLTAAPSLRSRPDPSDIQHAAALLTAARRPMVLAGGGVHLAGAQRELLELATAQHIPVAHTLSGKGAVPCVHDLSAGIFGRYSRYANELINSSDCLLVVGCKLGEIATKRYTLPLAGIPLIHLDIEPAEIGRWAAPTVALWGDARLGLRDLIDASAGAAIDMAARETYLADLRARRQQWYTQIAHQFATDEVPISMPSLMGALNTTLPDDAIVVADGGFASHWAGLFYDTRQAGRTFIADRGFASIGYGLPGALGAQLADRSRTVVGITGDGGLNMSLGGLETAVRSGAPFTLIVINNAASGYVKALQHAMYGPDSYQSSDLTELDYAAIAHGFGCNGRRVERPDDLRPALQCAISERECPTVLDVVVTRDPSRMLPGTDSRTVRVQPGDRIA